MIRIYIIGLVLLLPTGCNKKSEGPGQTQQSQPEDPTAADPTAAEEDEQKNSAGTVLISATMPANSSSTHVAAFPIQGGRAGAESVSGTTGQPITAGSVAITLGGASLLLEGGGEEGSGGGENGEKDGELSHVIIAYKEGKDRFETGDSFKFINVPVGNSEALNLYTSEVKTDKIDLGQINENGDSFLAENSIKEGDFSIDNSVLEELAATDDSLRSIKNAYMNTDPTTKESVGIRPFFQWSQSFEQAVNAFSSPGSATYFGYGLYFDTDRSDFSLDALCNEGGPNHKVLKLVPPGPLTTGSYYTNTDTSQVTELSNAGAGAIKTALGTRTECGGTSFYGHGDSAYNDLGWNWGGILGPIAEGYWDLFLADKKVARFDLAAVFPFDSNGKPTIYLPSINITTTGTKVTKVEIKFYRYISGVLTELTDLTAFRKVISELGMSFTSFAQSGQKEEFKTFAVPETGTIISPDLTKYEINWNVGDSADGTKIEAFAFQYNLFGNDYRFELRPANN